MKAEDFVGLSGKLVTMGPAGARSAVSRAYYGAFHAALTVLEELVSAPAANARSHNLVPIFLKSANHPDGNFAARLLSDLHGDRIDVDYKLDMKLVESVNFAKSGVETAVEILKRLEQFRAACLQDPAVKQALRDGIEKVRASFKI